MRKNEDDHGAGDNKQNHITRQRRKTVIPSFEYPKAYGS